MTSFFHIYCIELIHTKLWGENDLKDSQLFLWLQLLYFSYNYWYVTPKCDFFKALVAPNPILTLEAGNKLAIRLRSCFMISLEIYGSTDHATLCSNDTPASSSFSHEKLTKVFLLKKGLVMVQYHVWWSTKSVT